ncbi:hypothetical protein VD0002_g9161 [Verticillium dahliae]|uniref:Uncharacterized protein n=1 Tax=Verticillium dahliae TaxID=27337 RepID=A0AA44WDH4_VERDA|nr:hypothetical protein BJF96_g7142 [Verticillium dahliae]PNH37410.1 hypothetical protein VD0004_g9381 [Verticillium dahliae]PNH44238.1 hypothetical protein VD0003_g9469 [Verticillium dahliae]PNH58370.1 hypothetical protein VD0002_g9161 [Verticillium dahliae]PNH62519.1 hypothetical protein VD0001_g9416 [Verticillium dahliae]
MIMADEGTPIPEKPTALKHGLYGNAYTKGTYYQPKALE